MKPKRYRNDDLLADGERLSVPLYCMDSVQQSVSRDARLAARIDARHNNRGCVRVAAADGDPMGLHRPGWRIPAQDARPTAGHVVTDAGRQAVHDAREAYLRDLTNAWRGDAWRRGAGKEDIVPDAPKVSGSDAMPVDDTETAYRLYAEEIS